MSGHADEVHASPLGIAGGTVVGAGAALLVGMIVAPLFFAVPEQMAGGFAAGAWRVFAGLFIGGIGGLVIGGCVSWHAGTIAVLPDREPSAWLWGVLTGVVMGLCLGPVFGFVLGFVFGYAVEGGLFGLVYFPLGAALSWQATYWITQLTLPADERHSHA